MEELTLYKGLQLAVKTEKMGAEFYAKMADQFADNETLAAIFGQLYKDEKVHEAQFAKILETVSPSDNESNYEIDQYTRAIAISEFFRAEEMLTMKQVESAEEALGKALSFEKSTLLYYISLKEIIGESTALDAIIKAEREHIAGLVRILVTDSQFRGLRDKW